MIKITDEYYADADKYNWILYKKHIITEQEALKSKDKKAGDAEYKPLTYHANLQNVLKKVMDFKQKNLRICQDLNAYYNRLEQLQNEFLEQIKNLKEV